MIVRTVGELKVALSSLDDNMPLDFMAEFLDRGHTNYVVVDRCFGVLPGGGIRLSVYQDGEYCRIENLEAHEMTLEY